MPDLDIRETARQAALSEYSHANVRDRYDADLMMAGFTDGAQWAVEQLPDAEEIAAVLRHHNFSDNLLGNITWDMWMAKCDCGWESPEFRYPGESHDAHSAHAADAVLALIGEKISGGAETPR